MPSSGMVVSHPDAVVNTPLAEDECYHVNRVVFRMLKGPDKLQVETGPYALKGKIALGSDKVQIKSLLTARGLKICTEEDANFALQGHYIQAFVVNKCAIKARVRLLVRIQEIAAFLLPEPSHIWTAVDTVVEWDMDLSDTFYVPVTGVLPPKFGSLGPFTLQHSSGNVTLNGKWTGPRSGVQFDSGTFYKSCEEWVSATQENPVGWDLFFSSPYADCTFDEDCGGVRPPGPLSDNFNNLPWKSFWDYRTYSPATSFPIGSYEIIGSVSCLGSAP